jgi:hypothetical protein
MKSADEIVALVDIGFAVPLALLMNFSLFQYLLTTFWGRRNERRVRLLFFVAFLSCVSLVPFAFPDRALGRNLNDVSEVCTVLTFLMQITILTRDVSKRLRIRSVFLMMWCGEVLVAASVLMLLANVIDIIAPVISLDVVHLLDNIVEHLSLVFIVVFRFYFLAMAKGYRKVLATQKQEIVFYLCFLLHEIPFHIVEHFTHLDVQHLQAVWMRMTIAMCLSTTIKARLSSTGSKIAATSTRHGPVASNYDKVSQRKISTHKSEKEPEVQFVPWRKPVSIRPVVAVAQRK